MPSQKIKNDAAMLKNNGMIAAHNRTQKFYDRVFDCLYSAIPWVIYVVIALVIGTIIFIGQYYARNDMNTFVRGALWLATNIGTFTLGELNHQRRMAKEMK
jgi:hypothetical protein